MPHLIQCSILIFLCSVLAACGAREQTPLPEKTHTPSLLARELNNEAVKALESGDFKTARQKVNKAIADDPEFAMPYYNQALLQVINKKYGLARDALQKCVQLDEKQADAHLLLGLLLEEDGNITEAAQAYQIAKTYFSNKSPETVESELFHAIAVYLGDGLAPGLEVLNILVAKYPENPLLKDIQQHIRSGERDFFLTWLLAQKTKAQQTKASTPVKRPEGKKKHRSEEGKDKENAP
jgi:tetratricopeptide (TPR) repeat protein